MQANLGLNTTHNTPDSITNSSDNTTILSGALNLSGTGFGYNGYNTVFDAIADFLALFGLEGAGYSDGGDDSGCDSAVWDWSGGDEGGGGEEGEEDCGELHFEGWFFFLVDTGV
ncbi:hypothetical protein TWF192_008975 [Orbilia oligospora]|nr:hypothetical protein TWF192_008975 [Orbilia oligospora]